jgi:hypothetical protein
VANPDEKKLSAIAAEFFSTDSPQAVSQLSAMGIGGIFVPAGSSGAQQDLRAHVSASDGAQVVVDNDSGLYVTIHSQSGHALHIDTSGEAKALSDPLRILWVVLLSAVTFIYCLVAIPRFRFRSSGR